MVKFFLRKSPILIRIKLRITLRTLHEQSKVLEREYNMDDK